MGNPEAGWYDDGSGRQRWWDGGRWTEHFADLSADVVELRTSAVAPFRTAAAGWYDDQRGRLRWWDGRRWTSQSQLVGVRDSFAGISVGGQWIHYGDLSQPLSGVTATFDPLTLTISIAGSERSWAARTPPGYDTQAREFVALVNAAARRSLPR